MTSNPLTKMANTSTSTSSAFKGKLIVVSGPPCSGKGTLCKQLAAQFSLVHLSTGSIFREELNQQPELGAQAKTT